MFLLCRDYSNLPYNSTIEFQIDLAKDLIGNYNSRKRLGRPSSTSLVKKFANITSQYKELREFIVVTTVANTVKDVEKQSGTAKSVSSFFVIMVEKMTVFDFTILFMVLLLILRKYKAKHCEY